MNDRIKLKQEIDALEAVEILKSISYRQSHTFTECTYAQIDKRYLIFICHFLSFFLGHVAKLRTFDEIAKLSTQIE